MLSSSRIVRPLAAVGQFAAASKNYVTGANITFAPARRTRRTNAFAAAMALAGFAVAIYGYVQHRNSMPSAQTFVQQP